MEADTWQPTEWFIEDFHLCESLFSLSPVPERIARISFIFAPLTPPMTNLLSPHRLPTHPGLARSLRLPVSYACTALCTRISRWLRSSHIGSIIHPSKNHLYLVSLFTRGLALPQSQLCHSNQSAVNEKQLLFTRVKHNTAALGRSGISCIISNCSASIHLLLCWALAAPFQYILFLLVIYYLTCSS